MQKEANKISERRVDHLENLAVHFIAIWCVGLLNSLVGGKELWR